MAGRSRPPLTRARAKNCYLANQFATPGMGSLMGGRWIEGTGQVAVAVWGVVVACVGFWRVIKTSIQGDPALNWATAYLLLLGVGIFALAWLWALVTSHSLRREAEANERAQIREAADPETAKESGSG